MTVEQKNEGEVTIEHSLERDTAGENADVATVDPTQPKQPVHVDNKLFKDYYVMQGIVSVEELDKFVQQIRKPLPLTFRITGDSSNVKDTLKVLKQHFIEKNNIPLVSLPWYSDELAWQLNADELSADQSTAVSEFKQFIQQEAASGNVSQQDALSLIPSLLLDAKPEHKILDMRAGSGQVVSQVLDRLLGDGKQREIDGFVLASETDLRQCRQLADRLPKLTSPNFAVINLNESYLQDLHLPQEDSKSASIRYDRILCHLPSSGDGMFRKNIEALRGWSALMPFNYHGPLCQALYSALSQLAVGGRLVFYTDSMNPVENEAILYTVITQQRGSVALLDISSDMPNILYEKGLDSWKVMAKGPRWFKEHSEVPEALREQMWETMFPPPTKEEAEQFHLERCVRILPHRQDTAGMFIAVLTRTETLEACWKREQEQYQAWLKAEEEKAAAERAAAKKAAAERAAARREAAEKAAAERQAARKAAAEKAAAEKAAAEKAAAEKAAAEKAAAEKAAAEKAAAEKDASEKDADGKDVAEGEEVENKTDVTKMDVEAPSEESLPAKAEQEEKSSVTEVKQEENIQVQSSESKQEQEKMSETKNDADIKDEISLKVSSGEDAMEVDKAEKVETKGESVSDATDKSNSEDVAPETASAESSKPEGSVAQAAVPEPQHADFSSGYQPMGNPYDNSMHVREISKEDQFVFLTETDPVWLRIQEFFNLSKNFPVTQLAVRSRDNSCVFYLSQSLKSLTLANQKSISFVHAGVKVFCRVSAPDCACNYRLTQEGLPLMYPYLQRRIVLLARQDFLHLLSSHTTDISTLTKETQKKLGTLDTGNVLLVYKLDGRHKSPASQLMISCWKHELSCRSFLPAYQRQHYLLSCGSDVPRQEELSPAEAAKNALTAFAEAMSALEQETQS